MPSKVSNTSYIYKKLTQFQNLAECCISTESGYQIWLGDLNMVEDRYRVVRVKNKMAAIKTSLISSKLNICKIWLNSGFVLKLDTTFGLVISNGLQYLRGFRLGSKWLPSVILDFSPDWKFQKSGWILGLYVSHAYQIWRLGLWQARSTLTDFWTMHSMAAIYKHRFQTKLNIIWF